MIDALADMLRRYAPILVLSGAGMSTSSGLPDYRGPSGLWRNRRFEELASIDMWQREPTEFWEFYRMRLDALRHASPNAAHHALADLERAGFIDRVVTQNVDGLHRQAGSTTVEVHGTLSSAECLACGTLLPMDAALAAAGTRTVPHCTCGAVLKPGVVLFGEMLPPTIDDAFERARTCSALLVLGTSLKVQPVASMVSVAAAHAAPIAIITQGTTDADDIADIRIDGDLVPALTQLASILAAE